MPARGLHPFLAVLMALLLASWVTPRGLFHDCDHGHTELPASDGGTGVVVGEDCAICDLVMPPCQAGDRPAGAIAPTLAVALPWPASPQVSIEALRCAEARGPPAQA